MVAELFWPIPVTNAGMSHLLVRTCAVTHYWFPGSVHISAIRLPLLRHTVGEAQPFGIQDEAKPARGFRLVGFRRPLCHATRLTEEVFEHADQIPSFRSRIRRCRCRTASFPS